MIPYYELYADHVVHQAGDAFPEYLLRAKWIILCNGGDL